VIGFARVQSGDRGRGRRPAASGRARIAAFVEIERTGAEVWRAGRGIDDEEIRTAERPAVLVAGRSAAEGI
jgi:hypothetical protein